MSAVFIDSVIWGLSRSTSFHRSSASYLIPLSFSSSFIYFVDAFSWSLHSLFPGVELVSLAVEAANNRLKLLKQNPLNEEQNNSNENPYNVEFRAISFFDISTEKADLFDFIYDYTFLCAFDPSVRTLWAEKMSDLLNIGGELLTIIFPLSDDKEGGPPYRMSFGLLKSLLGAI